MAKAVEREADRRIQIWLRVRLGGQRMTEVAYDYGYRDGSGVHRVIRRLEAKAQSDRKLQSRLNAWRRELSRVDPESNCCRTERALNNAFPRLRRGSI